jgi:cyclophilin family peptidyl-prolyl cis-trans isomerase
MDMKRFQWMLPLWAAAVVLSGCGGADTPDNGTQVTARMFERQAALADAALCATHASGATSAVSYQEVDGQCMAVFIGGDAAKLAQAKSARVLVRAAKAVDATAFLDWAQQVFKPFFPDNAATVQSTGFAYRYYPSTQNYIAVLDDSSIYILGPVTGNALASVGKLADFSCSIYPQNCPQVSGIGSAAALSFSKAATLVVSGTALDQGITLTAPGCGTVTELAGGSATQRQYSCAAVSTATQLPVTVKNPAGATLLSANLAVPDPQVTIVVANFGTMVLELYPAKAPITVNNFLKYTHDGFYSNTLFHRVISNFVIQGGGLTPGLVAKATTYPAIKLESNNGLSNVRGTVAMARTSVADSATSQYYINTVDNSSCLDYGKLICDATGNGYAVFGQVVQGLSLVDAIRVVPTSTRNGYTDAPTTDVVVQSITQTR